MEWTVVQLPAVLGARNHQNEAQLRPDYGMGLSGWHELLQSGGRLQQQWNLPAALLIAFLFVEL
jgi:hypothetical protein